MPSSKTSRSTASTYSALQPHLIARTILDSQDETGETTMLRDVLARMFDDFDSITDEELADLCTA